MNTLPDFPRLDSPARCAALWPRFPEKAVGLWATGLPRQNVDVLWRLREELIKLGVPAVFFFTESAKPMLRTILAAESGEREREREREREHIYQLDEATLLFQLDFLQLLVTNDYTNGYQLLNPRFRKLPQKLILLQHTINTGLTPLNMYADYLCVNTPAKKRWTFKKFPPQFTIHQQGQLSLLPTGYLKLDLVVEARKHNYDEAEGPIFLFYIGNLYVLKRRKSATTDGFIHAWRELARNLLAEWPKGKVVFRPMSGNRNFPEIKLLAEYVSTHPRLVLDLNDDNIYWLSRADYFITDISTAWENWMFSSLRRAILLQYTPDSNASSLSSQPGLIQSTSDGMADAVKTLQTEDAHWRSRLLYQRRIRYPFAGRAFERLAGMLARIAVGNDEPAWHRLDKASTACATLGDTLRFTAWFCGRDNPFQGEFHFFFPMIRTLPGGNDCRVGLLLLKCGLVIYGPGRDPVMTARVLAPLLEDCLEACPPSWVLGVIRFCLKKNASLTRQVCVLAHYDADAVSQAP